MDDITKIVNYLRRQGATTVSRDPGEGPGGADIEAYWETGDAWLVRVLEAGVAFESIGEQLEEEIERMWLESKKRRAQAVVASVGEWEILFKTAMDWKAIEIPEP